MKKISFFLTFLIITMSINAQDSLQQFTGKYIFPDGSVVPDVEVSINEGALYMSSTAGISSLAQLGVDSFAITEFNGIALFKRGEDKKVNGVHIDAMGYILDGKKQEDGTWSFHVLYRKRIIAVSLP